MPQTNKEKKALLNSRRAKLGLKRKEFWLTDSEHSQMKDHLARLRSKTPNKTSGAATQPSTRSRT